MRGRASRGRARSRTPRGRHSTASACSRTWSRGPRYAMYRVVCPGGGTCASSACVNTWFHWNIAGEEFQACMKACSFANSRAVAEDHAYKLATWARVMQRDAWMSSPL
eukprot:1155050-Pelagomonas_calceolata.AAC.2